MDIKSIVECTIERMKLEDSGTTTADVLFDAIDSKHWVKGVNQKLISQDFCCDRPYDSKDVKPNPVLLYTELRKAPFNFTARNINDWRCEGTLEDKVKEKIVSSAQRSRLFENYNYAFWLYFKCTRRA